MPFTQIFLHSLVGRLLYAAVVAVPHHQEKKLAPYQSTTEIGGENQDTTP